VGTELDRFEIAELYFERCEFTKAEGHYLGVKREFLAQEKFGLYLKCIQRLLRIYSEMERFSEVDLLKERLSSLVNDGTLNLDSRTYFTYALCEFFRGRRERSLQFAEHALSMALANDSKEDICYAIHALSIVYAASGRYEDSLKEIYNLQVFFHVISVPELDISSQIVNAHILRKVGQFEKALELLWVCYERLKTKKNFLLQLELLYALGITYQDSGQKDLARLYLDLAIKSLDPQVMRHMAHAIKERMDLLRNPSEEGFDLVFHSGSKIVTERKRGRVDFNNQFILLDLLKMFLRKPGEVHTKEDIVEKVWRQKYDPSVHDNKLYVTIKRLRKLIEPEYEKPRYIFRAKNGYYLNKNTKVMIETV
jgi:tetratricopeptide (TPR) repeat protein